MHFTYKNQFTIPVLRTTPRPITKHQEHNPIAFVRKNSRTRNPKKLIKKTGQNPNLIGGQWWIRRWWVENRTKNKSFHINHIMNPRVRFHRSCRLNLRIRIPFVQSHPLCILFRRTQHRTADRSRCCPVPLPD